MEIFPGFKVLMAVIVYLFVVLSHDQANFRECSIFV